MAVYEDFACTTCEMCEGAGWRERVAAALGGDTPQYDHCHCDKVGGEFWDAGYCEDAFDDAKDEAAPVKRKSGRAYRRKMFYKKQAELRALQEIAKDGTIRETAGGHLVRRGLSPECRQRKRLERRARRREIRQANSLLLILSEVA